ncbi:MAG: hypothetical protein A2754_00070 [Candidatus Magasanikbacteria bacterium RIFCSPHIGHO2_01_FULL_47_8]|uniref:Aminotransferase class III n=1 Tax=Candidatus Magasanikbacteria bacterium RIFCSPHIGHO2_01_FULL_47_8 TaxID=1798673 RepID=A0A1F6MEE2_9BACT|nr:MAG: hypothetical protein A2754_00070 [Candidatus Magasanikbacteria bacterium RIFCSPHIGHO2_01_FULL_47_8]
MARITANSKALFERALRHIPRASQTLSKAPDQFVKGVSPYAFKKGIGCRVWDVDDNEYIDLSSSLGGIVLGYQHPVVEEAVRKQRQEGTIFGLPGGLEVELAERLTKLLPFVEMVRYGLNGSDVTAAAIRVSRAYTGRDHVAKCGYHGWPDWTIATNALRSKGVPQAVKDLTHEFAYNDLSSLEKIFNEFPNKIAAVIMEPIDAAPPKPGFLESVKELAHKHGAVFIFDELVTGFRLAHGGAAEYFKVTPDLVCYGKAISNGEPLSVLGGKREIMSMLDEVFFSFTYAGYLPSIAAALATLTFMEENDVQGKIQKTGAMLMEGCQNLISQHKLPLKMTGYPAHPVLSFKGADGADNLPLKTLFLQETAKAGIFTNCKHFTNYAHEEADIRVVLEKIDAIFKTMAEAMANNNIEKLLEGPIVRARYVR